MHWIYQNQFFILLGLLAIMSAIFWFIHSKANKKLKILLGGGDFTAENLQQELLHRLTKAEIKLEELDPRMQMVEAASKMSVQKTGFLRFNPFPGTGGDNSFVVTFLDKENNGVILSSLYTREGVRIYAKQVSEGISRHPLSDEENKVLEETLNK